MDTILLVIGVVGLSISGWVLRGYFLNTPSVIPSADKQHRGSVVDRAESGQEKPITYVTSQEHQQVLTRLAELEKGGYSPTIKENGTGQPTDTTEPQASTTTGSTASQEKETKADELELSEAWKEIYALQQAYRLEREKESEIDYEREQILFDLSQGYDGRFTESSAPTELSEEDRMNQRLLDNQLEDGEELTLYQERISELATLTKEVLLTRLEEKDNQLREQQERHQAALLTIISTLIERLPGDVNVKSVVQSSYVAASKEISNEEGEANRVSFAEMFHQHVRN